MKLIKVVPNIFYSDIRVGLNLFVECLGFKILYNDEILYIIERDAVTLHLKEDDEFAKKDRPEIRIETDDIEGLYREIENKNMGLLHPNLPKIKLQPWGLKEFALLDETTTCVIIFQRQP
jgi:hypothetical protein